RLFLFALIQSFLGTIPSIVMGRYNLLHDLGIVSTAFRFFWIGYYALMPLSVVLLARSMRFTTESSEEERKHHLNKTLTSIISLSLPIAVGIYVISKEAILLIAGPEYSEAIPILQVISSLVVIMGLNNFWSMQVVYSSGKDNILLYSNLAALVVSLSLSFTLIPRYGAYGAVAAYIASFLFLLLLSFFFGKKSYTPTTTYPEQLKVLIAVVIMYLSVNFIELEGILTLVVKIILGSLVYVACLVLFRHRLAKSAL